MTDTAMFEVCEIFYSLQGESTYSGMPCIFIRMADCNLRCSYCDTPQSYAAGTLMDIVDILMAISIYPCKTVEITGGEPLLQEQLPLLLAELDRLSYRILLETNGSLYLGDIPEYVIKIVDVKTPGSCHGDSFMKWNLKQLNAHDEIKFVISNFYDYLFAREFIKSHNLQDRIIHFSPVLSALPAKTLTQWMLADGSPARLHLQLHKILEIS